MPKYSLQKVKRQTAGVKRPPKRANGCQTASISPSVRYRYKMKSRPEADSSPKNNLISITALEWIFYEIYIRQVWILESHSLIIAGYRCLTFIILLCKVVVLRFCELFGQTFSPKFYTKLETNSSFGAEDWANRLILRVNRPNHGVNRHFWQKSGLSCPKVRTTRSNRITETIY